jgi:hypothetical protein
VGGEDQEGRFAPSGKTGALKEEEEDAKAEAEDKTPVDLGPAGAFAIDSVLGFGGILDPTNSVVGTTGVTVLSIVPALSYRFAKIWTVGARLPFSNASIEGPAEGNGDDFSTWVVGNLELYVRPSFQITRRLRLPASLAFYFPTAPGDLLAGPTGNIPRAQALVGQAAMATRGWEELALFAPSRISVAAAVGLTYDAGALHGAVGTKLELMFQSGGAEPNTIAGQPIGAVLRDPVPAWVTSVSASYDFFDGYLSPGLRAWLAVVTVPIAVGTVDYSGAQLAVEPEFTSRVSLGGSVAVRGGAGVILPIGGHLGGADDASVLGVRLRAALLF